MIEVSKEQRERLIREVGRWYSAFRELGAVPFEQDLDAIRRLIESSGGDRAFIAHIQAHLKPGQEVVCRICGRTAEEIIHEVS